MNERDDHNRRSAITAETTYWVVVRQDTHGTRFDVAEFPTQEKAAARIAEFEAGYPHHQTYFVEERRRA